MEAVDPRLEQAARTLGAGPLDTFLSVTLPLTGSGIVVGAILAFARSLGEFGATITFVSAIPGETTTLPIALYGLAQVPGQEPAALRLVILSVLIAFAAMLGSELVARRVRRRIAGA
jgi:molybdate transport system permease protein